MPITSNPPSTEPSLATHDVMGRKLNCTLLYSMLEDEEEHVYRFHALTEVQGHYKSNRILRDLQALDGIFIYTPPETI